MQIDEFQELFSLFCLKTYVLEKTEFDESEIKNHLLDAIKYYKRTERVGDVLFDLKEAVCLIMREGHSFFFVHRSFQEFFTAYFLSLCPQDTRDHFLNEVAVRRYDGVLSMLFEMAKDQIEATWILENSTRYLEAVGIEKVGKIHPFVSQYSSIDVVKFDVVSEDGSVRVVYDPVKVNQGP